MRQSIRDELLEHLDNLISDEVLTLDNIDDWHFHAFNEDYYIIGSYKAKQWLQGHDVSPFEAIETIREYEQDNFGEVYTDFSNSERVVNMYVYILGEQLLFDVKDTLTEQLKDKEETEQ